MLLPGPPFGPGLAASPRLPTAIGATAADQTHMKAARDLKEAHPVAARAVIAGGNRDAVGLRVAGLKMETHPLVKRDRAAVHRGGDRADQAAAASLSGPEERLIEQAAQPAAAVARIHPDKVNAAWPCAPADRLC